MNSTIKFEAEGWCGKFGKDISFANIRRYILGYINYLRYKHPSHLKGQKVIVSFDSNFISKKLAWEAVRILSINNIMVFSPVRDLPLSSVSLYLIENDFTGALDFRKECRDINSYYMRILNDRGQITLPSESSKIEWEILQIKGDYTNLEYAKEQYIKSFDLIDEYMQFLIKKVDIPLLKKASGKFIIDSMFGSSRDIIDRIFLNVGIEFISIHNFDDPSWGEIIPVVNKKNLAELSELVIKEKKLFGIAIDKDCFEIAVVDGKGKLLDHEILQLLLIEYLFLVKKFKGGIIKSIISSININRLAKNYNISLYETFMGNKYLSLKFDYSKAFVAIQDDKSLIFNTKSKLKNGMLFALYVIEMFAYFNFKIKELFLNKKYPRIFKSSDILGLTKKNQSKYNQLFKSKKFIFTRGLKLLSVSKIDGIRFNFKDSFLLVRENTFTNRIQLFSQSYNIKESKELIKNGQDFFK